MAELNKEAEKPGFWNDNESAQKILKEKSLYQKPLDTWKNLDKGLNYISELINLSHGEDDLSLLSEIQGELNLIEKEVADFELRAMLSGEHDRANAILSIHPGAGGTESQDWAEMLLRMYLRWAERRGYKTEITDYQPGEGAGIKDATITVSGEYAYGYLRAEKGVHRLVRISPFDANKRRHTSFVSVNIVPEIEDDIKIEIDEEDLRIDTYRSSGAGGQHVNKTDSAVRITHIPTGIVVQCQNERSQHKNKATAMKILRSHLYKAEEEKQRERLEKIQGEKKEIGWGNQIRSYVLHPYRLVKDLRTKVEVGNADAVLDGEIDMFIEAFLLKGAA
ncbi:MAG: peptide chain release factor 2 [Nitrospinae bacterium RIFCSPLOWO2_02_FULL_39_110]|nr:MAG: peptide chain release factor 2 [Nitrospinae bacterium RIFCSPHIGHO2_12_FULL_39_42]OGW00320.1 MAG: peptide chain release factor 2 [Nitrospinae bacterium RIFCSPHIGHO2_02_FULL_39_82]OGW02470.1 MAG: peptide chain release factor 2 [Nitrospinae bacterium RIFCSPLOWO2_02_39_17]OGW07104.1 MAG: peptide chain release factor 2 [Nitrospinae bacterium RIFCSPLOWO2_02_FULL_39_110]OGW11857.1 MAG: peptide chain release factor 2 [Nitrospinae bacterium RIFCSPLOWO2_12_FULL_39_93]OGW11957.1 MAG: peptide chai